ncbi:hypothetical protein ZIOFF_028009 [Zingiber officinale]|uniref:Uncharacterized protein n=1 Tax=Zingiber officinale TaxID=94328 RepID=A0A8J5GUB9_ZINOF|nr:hypothetical protein ZIOFF_028009 [Zingiber officinale]
MSESESCNFNDRVTIPFPLSLHCYSAISNILNLNPNLRDHLRSDRTLLENLKQNHLEVTQALQESFKEQRRLQQAILQLQKEGYQAVKHVQPRRLSNIDIEEIRDEGEEEFVGIVTEEYALPLFCEEYGYPDTNDRWDTLGEPSGRYNYYVNYAAPPVQLFVPATRPSWGDEEDHDNEAVFPSIWEDTPWEEDPKLNPTDLPLPDEDQEEFESYYLGLEDLENDYPVLSPNSVLQDEDNQQLPIYWDDSSSG